MKFTGRLYYDFESKDVWRFFQLLLLAQREGVEPGLEWRPFLTDGMPDGPLTGHARLLAAAEVVRHDAAMSHGAFVAGALSAVHGEGMAVEDAGLIAVAAGVAQLDVGVVSEEVVDGVGWKLLAACQAEAEDMGVDAVPSLYRHGPVLAIRTTGAVTLGSGLRRLEVIDAMLRDDGLWELRKP